jgi:23S rRNA pseudouridine1911/1915/1917 synthase
MTLTRKDKFVVLKTALVVDFMLEQCSFLGGVQDVTDLFSEQRILCNGDVISQNIQLQPGDMVVLLTSQQQEPEVDSTYDVIYEDDELFVVNKSGNLPVHPAGKYYFNTLTSLLERTGYGVVYPVHRLDRETSGLVLFAKTEAVATYFQRQQREGHFLKSYLCIVHGELLPQKGVIKQPLLRTHTALMRHAMVVDAQGKPAQTTYAVQSVSPDKQYSFVRATLHMGKKHQIRVHFAHIGHPLVGDSCYGIYSPQLLKGDSSLKGIEGISRQSLHCECITFTHPTSKKKMTLEANIPADMSTFIKAKHLILSSK